MPFMDDTTYNMDVDVDDLFGDSEQVPLPHLTVAPIKGLARRLDELSASGCCQRIAWGKSGCVAFISADGYAVNLRAFARDPSTGKWDLGKVWELQVPHEAVAGFPYVHISWNALGTDLVVVDAAGHVLIFNCISTLEHMEYKRVELAQPEADMDSVVGMHWLALSPHEVKTTIVWSASGTGEKWSLRTGQYMIPDLHHPMDNKAAMMYLKRYGELRMRYQQVNNSWHEVVAQLGTTLSTSEAFSHAAFASNGDNSSLLLAAYDVSGRLHLYRIETKWSAPPPPVKQGQPLKPFEKPELIASEICTEDICYPINTVGNGNLDDTATFQIRIPAQLTHLNFLPKTPESDDGSLPTIQAIFSTPPATPSFDHAQPHQDPYSILVRWEVHRTQKNQLHPSLDQVTSKKKSVGSIPARDELSLKRLDDTVLRHDTVILAFHPYWYNMILAYCYSDGSIEFRKRATMEVLGPDFNTETLTSIFQTGFAFPQHEPSLHVALSPNYCIAAGMQQDGTIKLRPIEYTYGSLSVDDGDPKHSAALASLVLQCASGTNQYSSTDDIFAIMGELSEKKKDEFLTTMFQGLHVTLDCTGEEALTGNSLLLLGRSPFFVRTLSAAHLLGLQGTLKRSISSKVAWMVLNIKSMTQFITTIMRMHNPIETSIVRPEMVPQSLGFIRWMVSFMVYVVDELFTVGRELQKLAPNPLNRATIEETITTLNKPAILVLLSSFARIMMKTWPNFLTWVQKTASRIGPRQVNNLEMIKLYAPLQQVLYEMPFRWSQFESLLTDTHNLVRRTYHRANLSETQRNLAERELLLGRCPDVLIPVAKHLLTDALFGEQSASSSDATNKDAKPGLADKINVASVHFFDTTWLGLTDSRAARAWHATHVVDVVQKMILRGKGAQKHPPPSRILGATRLGFKNMNPALDVEERVRTGRDRLRKCTRCASYMDDVRVGVSGYLANHAQMIMGAGRHCVCGNSWGLVEGPFV